MPARRDAITDIPGIRVGHWTDERALTGCTVILPPPGTCGSVVVPGGAPATRETDAVAPGRRVQEVHAREGQLAKKGEVLLTLQDVQARAQLEQVRGQWLVTMAREARLVAQRLPPVG